MTKPKEIRYCSHVESQTARPYTRLTGAEYDMIVCWNCQNESAPFINQINDLSERLCNLIGKANQ